MDRPLLTGVSETALLTLNGRAHQAGLPDAILTDPMAIELRDALGGAFAIDFGKFGRQGQEMALRAIAADRCTLDYLRTHPRATVVALAEGFQTSFWRLDQAVPEPQFRWVSIDLPPVIALREELLPPSPRITNIAQSALDYSWMDRIDATEGVFITAEGLLMYLQPDDAMDLIAACAERFPGGQMFFDLPPTIVKKVAPKGLRASKHYRVPPMPFSLSLAQLRALIGTVRGLTSVQDVPMPAGRGFFFKTAFPALWRFGPMKNFRGVYALLEFG
ncbi:MAG: class I SAM-dependent methyltransferase [Mycobacteriaceae bacterium]|nr:class I SAM-dependent methyltransferase [Mycobacterium sp.]NBQ42575.1 class I SAM-dependent methyltransferase [Mycobacteriaceae bacterium]